MKSLKKGSIDLKVSGMVEITSGPYPEIEINGKLIASYLSDALGLDKKGIDNAKFPGKVTLVIENFGGAEIVNTMTDASTVPETEPDSNIDVNLGGGDADAM
jgi:hypothetical protein